MGLFWKDKPAPIKNSPWEAPRLLPSIPETGWRPPTEFPNLSVAKTLSFDTETKDPFSFPVALGGRVALDTLSVFLLLLMVSKAGTSLFGTKLSRSIILTLTPVSAG